MANENYDLNGSNPSIAARINLETGEVLSTIHLSGSEPNGYFSGFNNEEANSFDVGVVFLDTGLLSTAVVVAS